MVSATDNNKPSAYSGKGMGGIGSNADVIDKMTEFNEGLLKLMVAEAKNVNVLEGQNNSSKNLYESIMLFMKMNQDIQMGKLMHGMSEANSFAGVIGLLGKPVAIKDNKLTFYNGKALIKLDGSLNGDERVTIFDNAGNIIHEESCKFDNGFITITDDIMKSATYTNGDLNFIIKSGETDLTENSHSYVQADFIEYKQDPNSKKKTYYIVAGGKQIEVSSIESVMNPSFLDTNKVKRAKKTYEYGSSGS
ncbi:hypothetical protein Cyrtocomes_00618 [Candidatus Cyrtobacter comes]|uniref:Basal-body rod modification protein FlgD n=1 Tax=Candidatus Cyrtobacter comes TaxID=675776 RepID=A0ABU5L7Z0_9RICK|nr:hypothetical protein [Candidatus Cyrtobacter comes]MDZ5762243.1 hypothetical protein [Candidatus Cyrtobacter comes]